MKYFRIFGSKFYIRRDENDLGKFVTRVDEAIFLGYVMNNKAYWCYNKRLKNIVESKNVKACEVWDYTTPKPIQKTKFQIILVAIEEIFFLKDNNMEEIDETEEDKEEPEQMMNNPKYVQRNHSKDQIIRDKNRGD